jgi:hypothetical protein
MGYRRAQMGSAAARMAGRLLFLLVAAGCGKTVIEIVNPPGSDASTTIGPAVSAADAAVSDATGGNQAVEAGSGEAGTESGDAGADAQGGFVVVDSGASCPGPDLRCHVDSCSGQASTSVSGKVYDPAMANPIPHAFVFVPTDPMGKTPAITPGAKTCDTCDLPIGSYVTATTSDATGSFSLAGVPTGTQIPLVVQIGKWRRESLINTTSCQDTALTPAQTHLPGTQAEGDMPAMALLTGGLDDLGCLLARFGIGHGEFSSPHGGGRLDVYQGLSLGGSAPGLSTGTAGNCTDTSCPLWSSKVSLESYDVVLLACEGDTFDATVDAGLVVGTGSNVTAAGKQAMHDWLGEGGKVFATHFHYTWFQNGPSDFQGVAAWKGYSLGTGQGSFAVETSFPKGQDFSTGLADAGVIAAGGKLALAEVGDSVSTVNAPALAWIEDPSTTDTKYLTFTTPVGSTCGKAAFSDLHAGGAPSGDVPGSCSSTTLSAQEKAMELLFFDLSACVSDDSKPAPGPPPSGG